MTGGAEFRALLDGLSGRSQACAECELAYALLTSCGPDGIMEAIEEARRHVLAEHGGENAESTGEV